MKSQKVRYRSSLFVHHGRKMAFLYSFLMLRTEHLLKGVYTEVVIGLLICQEYIQYMDILEWKNIWDSLKFGSYGRFRLLQVPNGNMTMWKRQLHSAF